MTNRTSTENTERVDSSDPEVGWRVEDPGEPRWADDPGWRTYGHDTANSFRNPRAEGPSDSPTVEWTFDPGVSTLAARAHHPTIVDGTVYTRRAVEPSDGPTDESRYQVVVIEGETGDVEPLIDSERPLARPVVTEDTIYAAIGSDRASIHAFDRDTGTERWRTDQLLYEPFTIRPVEDVVIATDASPAWGVSDGEPDADEGSPELFAIDSETGAVQWDARGIGPNINDDYGQALTTDAVSVFEGTATVRRLDDGEIAGVLPPLEGGAADRLSDALFDDTLVSVGQTDDGFVVAAHDWYSLEKRWSRTFQGDRGGSRPTVVDGVLPLLRPSDRTILGLDIATGETRWRTSPDIAAEHDRLGATLLAGRDELYGVLPGGGVFAVEPADGTVRWELRTEEMSWSPTSGLALSGELLVVVGSDGRLFAIS